MLDIKPRENKIVKKEEAPLPAPKQEEVKEVVSTQTEMNDTDKEQAKIVQLRKNRQKRLRRIIVALLSLTAFFFLTTLYLGFSVYELKKTESSQADAPKDIPVTPTQIVNAVSRLIVLPDSVPQIATVQDAKKLSTSQAFFKNATNGDVVLVFDTMIILYRPLQNIIVAVGDITGSLVNPQNGTATPK